MSAYTPIPSLPVTISEVPVPFRLISGPPKSRAEAAPAGADTFETTPTELSPASTIFPAFLILPWEVPVLPTSILEWAPGNVLNSPYIPIPPFPFTVIVPLFSISKVFSLFPSVPAFILASVP